VKSVVRLFLFLVALLTSAHAVLVTTDQNVTIPTLPGYKYQANATGTWGGATVTLQHFVDGAWRDIPGGVHSGNFATNHIAPPGRTMRAVVSGTSGSTSLSVTLTEASNAVTPEVSDIDGLADALEGKASSSLLSAAPDRPLTLMIHDRMAGPEGPQALNAIRQVYPGPGKFELTRSFSGGSTVARYEGGFLYAYNLLTTSESGAGTLEWTEGDNTGVALDSGGISRNLAMEVEFVANGPRSDFSRAMTFGFSDTTANARLRGAGGILWLANPNTGFADFRPASATTATDDGAGDASNLLPIAEGDRVKLRIIQEGQRRTAYYIQTKCLTGLGCHIGGENWYALGVTEPRKQIRTQGITAGASSSGTLTWRVTINSVNTDISVPVVAGDAAHVVATKIVAAMNADSTFNANWLGRLFNHANTPAMEAKTYAWDDTTATMTLQSAGGTGVTQDASGAGASILKDFRSGSAYDNTGKTVFPFVAVEHKSIAQLADFKLYSGATPPKKSPVLDYDQGAYGIHIPSLAKDPVSGLLVAGWHWSGAHVGTECEIRAAVRLADGTWSTKQTVKAPPGGISSQSFGALGSAMGKLWLYHDEYWSDAVFTESGVRANYRSEVMVNRSTGAITLGTKISLNLPQTGQLIFGAPVSIPHNGKTRWVLGGHTSAGNTYANYSDDNMATWTSVLVGTPTTYEPRLVIESDGAVGMWCRTNIFYTRYFRSTDGVTWSSAKIINAVTQPNGPGSFNGSRLDVIRRADGSMWAICNRHRTARTELTIYRIGDNGAVLDGGTILFSPGTTNTDGVADPLTGVQYPVLYDDGRELLVMFSHQVIGGSPTNTFIRLFSIPWPTEAVAPTAGGSLEGRNTTELKILREFRQPSRLTPLAGPTESIMKLKDNRRWYCPLSTFAPIFGKPTELLPWVEIELYVLQPKTGTVQDPTFSADWEFRGITPTWSNTLGETNVLKAAYNPFTDKMVVSSFN
jgi:hypothetical protein